MDLPTSSHQLPTMNVLNPWRPCDGSRNGGGGWGNFGVKWSMLRSAPSVDLGLSSDCRSRRQSIRHHRHCFRRHRPPPRPLFPYVACDSLLHDLTSILPLLSAAALYLPPAFLPPPTPLFPLTGFHPVWDKMYQKPCHLVLIIWSLSVSGHSNS
jgi:hypothetical protein